MTSAAIPSPKSSRSSGWWAVILLLGYLAWLYFGDPTDVNGLFPKCVFYKFTGLKCLGCGGQRAVHCLLHGDLAQAIRYNAFLVCVMPFYVLGFFMKPFKGRGWYVCLGFGAALVFMVVRNLPGVGF